MALFSLKRKALIKGTVLATAVTAWKGFAEMLKGSCFSSPAPVSTHVPMLVDLNP